MCGRATLVTEVTEIAEIFGVAPIDIGPARYNVAPGQPVVVVRNQKRGDDGDPPPGRELALLKWGLVPRWADAPSIGGRLVQARAETVATSGAYRNAFTYRRGLFVADGFYEWKTEPGPAPSTGTKKRKPKPVRIPHHLHRADGRPFAIAALWERWKGKDGTVLETCAVVTTEARGVVARIHDRMPLLLDEDAQRRWLTASHDHAMALVAHAPAIAEAAAASLVSVPVTTWVNDVKHDDPGCIAPANDADAATTEPPLRLRFDDG